MKLKQLTYLIIGSALLFHNNAVQAAGILSNETVLSDPAGSEFLPGFGNEGITIEGSILFTTIIPFVIQWGINLAIGLSVIFGIIGGYQLIVGLGNEEKFTKAVYTLIYAAVGLILSLTAYGIVQILTRIDLL